MSTDEILGGLALVLVLAVSSQLVARRLRIPAIVVLLPAGFLAGAVTTDVQPDNLLGSLYQPFVTLAVGVILFEAGLRLSARDMLPGLGATVARLVSVGVVITWAGVALAAIVLFDGLDHSLDVLIGAVLVVSGPTVVLPLLAHIRPSGRPLAAQVGGRAGRSDRRAAGRAGAARGQVERPPRGDLGAGRAVSQPRHRRRGRRCRRRRAAGAAPRGAPKRTPLCGLGHADDGGGGGGRGRPAA